MTGETFEEIFKAPMKEFNRILNAEQNHRIIFSGKFGVGKTSFFNFFFSHQKTDVNFKNTDYQSYWISPVNYSISSNEDIFRYIKFDLIIQLLEKGKQPRELDIRAIDALPSFFSENIDQIITTILFMIPKIGKEVSEYYDKINTLYKNLKKFSKNANESSGDKLISYLHKIEQREGSIYEDNVITQLIQKLISYDIEPLPYSVENFEEKKNSVLIIDDLDRLDPEHVFRILNIFAAHFKDESISGTRNKFGFDRIIIVCDIKNIRNIYHHKYGLDVDFNGYIDKFYSVDIFHFDNKQVVKKYIYQILETITVFELWGDKKSYTNSIYNSDLLHHVIASLITVGDLGIRNLIKMKNKTIEYGLEDIEYKSGYHFPSSSLKAAFNIRVLCDFFGDYGSLISKLKKYQHRDYSIYNYANLFYQLILVLTISIHNLESNTFRYTFRGADYIIIYKNPNSILIYNADSFSSNTDSNDAPGTIFKPTPNDFWYVLVQATEMLFDISYLK